MNEPVHTMTLDPAPVTCLPAEATATLVVDAHGTVLQAHLGARSVVCTRGELWTLADAIDNVHTDDRLALWTAFDRMAGGPVGAELTQPVRVLHDGWWCTTTVGIRADVQDGARVRVVQVGALVPQQLAGSGLA
jgi:hypothetical protein